MSDTKYLFWYNGDKNYLKLQSYFRKEDNNRTIKSGGFITNESVSVGSTDRNFSLDAGRYAFNNSYKPITFYDENENEFYNCKFKNGKFIIIDKYTFKEATSYSWDD